MQIGAPFDENECLEVNPFEGDFGTPSDRILKNKIVTARKGRVCGMCREVIKPGERIRTLTAIFDGQLMSYHWCSACCSAMATSWNDGGVAWESRVKIGNAALKRE
jgi:hypothetical protein